jgi:hypothetical protein
VLLPDTFAAEYLDSNRYALMEKVAKTPHWTEKVGNGLQSLKAV